MGGGGWYVLPMSRSSRRSSIVDAFACEQGDHDWAPTFFDGDDQTFSEVDAPEDLADCAFQEWACIHCGVEPDPATEAMLDEEWEAVRPV